MTGPHRPGDMYDKLHLESVTCSILGGGRIEVWVADLELMHGSEISEEMHGLDVPDCTPSPMGEMPRHLREN